MVPEDQTYKTAESMLGAALSQHNVMLHNVLEPVALNDVKVTIAGAPRSLSFSERVKNGRTGDNRENLSITFDPKFLDLRAVNDGDVKMAVMSTVKNLMSSEAFTLPNGSKLADAYNWDGENPEKITPKLDIVNDGKDNKIHLFLDLPAGATHWNVVDALAGVDTIKLKPMGAMEQKVAGGDAPAAQAPVADAPALTPAKPVVGDATSNLAKRATAANDDKALGVGS